MDSVAGEAVEAFDTGTVVFLFTDIEGSTRLWQEHPDAMKEALARHHELLRAAIAGFGGSVFQIVGDGFCAAFGTVQAAISAAIAAQRSLDIEPWDSTGPLRVRMALHAGPALAQREDASAGGYSSGLTLSHVSRLLGIGHGGQVLLSAAARGLVDGVLPDGAGLRDLGMQRLRDLRHPEHIYQLTAAGLRDSFPPLRSFDAHRGNLPAPLTSFIGRQRELAVLTQILDDTRLLTLTGSGGTGKTRLAVQLAHELESRFPDGAWMVELAPVADPAMVVQALATALGLREQPGRPLVATLKDHLAATRLLLLLDNCEHMLEPCASLTSDLLRASPELVVLTTSREPLAVPGEVTYRVASLSLPDARQSGAAANLMDYEAVQLFVERARAAQPSFRLTDANAAAIARICQRVDGIPLAIELAATRVRTLSADQIAARLDDYFSLLTGGSRSALPRQQTLRALIDWSYDLLSEPERVLLRYLSVFSGSWTLEAAESVGAGPRKANAESWRLDTGYPDPLDAVETGWKSESRSTEVERFYPGAGDRVESEHGLEPRVDVLETLGRLVDRSLVIAEIPDAESNDTLPVHTGETRYRLLEMVRQYAREKLLASGESAAVRDRHLAFFAALASESEMALHGRGQADWLVHLDAERDNLRAALSWAITNQPMVALNTAAHLREYWTRRGLATEGRYWISEALQRVEEMAEVDGAPQTEQTQARARGLTALATLMLAQGEYQNAYQAAQQGLRLARETHEDQKLVLPLAWFALVASMSGHEAEAYDAAHEMMALPTEKLPEVWLGMTLSTLANMAVHVEGDFEKARAYLLEGQRLARKIGDSWAEAMVTFNLGALAYRQADYPEAEKRYRESRALWEDIGDRVFMQLPTSGLADVARQTGDFDRASAMYREMIGRWQQAGNMGAIARCLECLAFIVVARGETDPDRERLWHHAGRLLGAAETLREASGVPMMPEEQPEYAQVKRRLIGENGGRPLPGVPEAWQEGRTLTPPQAVEYALREDSPATSV